MTLFEHKNQAGWFYKHAVHLGFAAVVLADATGKMLALPQLPPVFFLTMWLCTQWFYSISAAWTGYGVGGSRLKKSFYFYAVATLFLPLVGIALLLNAYPIHVLNFEGSKAWLFWPFLLLAASYYPVRTKPNRFHLRVALLKPFIVGIVWAWWVTAIPQLFLSATHQDVPWKEGSILHIMIYMGVLFTWVSALSDFRDVELDKRMIFPTWAWVSGSAKTIRRAALVFLLLGIGLCLFTMSPWIQTPLDVCFLLLPYVAASMCTWFVTQKQAYGFYAWAVDGILYLTALCFYCISIF